MQSDWLLKSATKPSTAPACASRVSWLRSLGHLTIMQAARALARVGAVARAAAPVLRTPVQARAAAPARSYSGRAPDGALEQLYHVLLKKNISFIMFILSGAIVMETVYGGMGDALWNTVNRNVR